MISEILVQELWIPPFLVAEEYETPSIIIRKSYTVIVALTSCG